jgi:hypothetical protein
MSEFRVPDNFDSGDLKQVKRKQAKGAAQERQLLNDFCAVMASPEGRRVMVWLLEQTGPYRSSFATNALQMAYQEGIRKLGLIVTDKMASASPETWVAMQLELLSPKEDTNV